MGYFGAVFGCSGDAGFSGPLLGVSSGVVGFNLATLSCLVCEKVRPAWPGVGASAKSSPCTLKTPQNRRFYACGASFFAPIGPAPFLDAAWCTSGWLRWGFCSIRSWLAACRRRVVPLMTPFPPFGGGPAEPPPGGFRRVNVRVKGPSCRLGAHYWTLAARLSRIPHVI